MTGGTIVQGRLTASTGADYFTVRDLGVDAGPAFTNSNNGGVATDAFALYNSGQVVGAPQVQSPLIENVSCLGYSPTAAFHCMLVENVNNAYVHNVQTVMNCHGLVLKGTNSRVDGVFARGHGIDSVIVKSDGYALVSPAEISGSIVIFERKSCDAGAHRKLKLLKYVGWYCTLSSGFQHVQRLHGHELPVHEYRD